LQFAPQSGTLSHVMRTFLLAIALFFVTAVPAWAESEFNTSITTSYIISPEGISQVRHDIAITNLTPTRFVSEYSLNIGSQRLKNIQAVGDKGRTIPVNLKTVGKETQISLNFPDQIVGKDKTRTFTLEYTNIDAAVKKGSVLELFIPALNSGHEANTQSVTISIPVEFGTPAVLSPPADQVLTDPVYRQLIFNRSNRLQNGITGYFGDSQSYTISLIYQLENPTITPVETQIALPPDTVYQRVFYETISPSPKSLQLDRDGNWLATYLLNPKEQVTITASGFITVSPIPRFQIPAPSGSLNDYLSSHKYWETKSPHIAKAASSLTTPADIYRYLVETFRYDENQSGVRERKGAANAINEPQTALCQDFSDTFIALARNRGIPARAHIGYGYTETDQQRPVSLVKDILHTWVDFYDIETGTWLSVDPTWGHTTGLDYFNQLDFSHITFAIHGLSSSDPLPAGYYNHGVSPTKHIEIAVSERTPMADSSFSIDNLHIRKAIIGSTHRGLITLSNTSYNAIYNPTISLSYAGQRIEIAPPRAILPHTHATIPFTFKGSIDEEKQATVTLDGTSQTGEIKLSYGYTPVAWFAAAAATVAITTVIARKTRRVLVSKRKR
jgi:transglutaminase-like putative cysteine protease